MPGQWGIGARTPLVPQCAGHAFRIQPGSPKKSGSVSTFPSFTQTLPGGAGAWVGAADPSQVRLLVNVLNPVRHCWVVNCEGTGTRAPKVGSLPAFMLSAGPAVPYWANHHNTQIQTEIGKSWGGGGR